MLDTSIRISRALAHSNALYREAASRLHTTYPEMLVLYALLALETCTQKDIGDAFGLTKQTVNHTIRNLQQRDMLTVQVSSRDKREKLVQLNENGQKYARDTVQPLLDLEKRVYALVGKSDLDAMSAAMDHFNRAFEDTLGKI